MNKYLVLYRSEVAEGGPSVSEMFANITPEQMQAGMAMWQAWYEKNGGAIVDMGAPLDKSTSVTPTGASSNKGSITGYTVIQAESMDEAVEMVNGHPHFFAPGASVEILEAVAMPGM